MARQIGQHGFLRTGSIQESEMKICDLCGSLNLESNIECFVCGWHGRFERGHDVIRAAVELAVRSHGRLELQHLTDIRTYCEARPTIRMRFWAWVVRLWQWLSG